jgi:hypothetical protein
MTGICIFSVITIVVVIIVVVVVVVIALTASILGATFLTTAALTAVILSTALLSAVVLSIVILTAIVLAAVIPIIVPLSIIPIVIGLSGEGPDQIARFVLFRLLDTGETGLTFARAGDACSTNSLAIPFIAELGFTRIRDAPLTVRALSFGISCGAFRRLDPPVALPLVEQRTLATDDQEHQ